MQALDILLIICVGSGGGSATGTGFVWAVVGSFFIVYFLLSLLLLVQLFVLLPKRELVELLLSGLCTMLFPIVFILVVVAASRTISGYPAYGAAGVSPPFTPTPPSVLLRAAAGRARLPHVLLLQAVARQPLGHHSARGYCLTTRDLTMICLRINGQIPRSQTHTF